VLEVGFGSGLNVRQYAPGVARVRAVPAAKCKARCPSAVACVTDDLASLTVHLRFPAEYGRRIRHSNFIERNLR
jgi:transposase-like protein